MSATQTGPEGQEIQAVLQDAGLDGDADLAAALGGMRALALDAPPAPRADLAALLAPGVSSLDVRRRSRQRRMGAVIGAVVVGTMGLGAGAVAASSEDFRRSVGHTVEQIFTPASQPPAPETDLGPSPSSVPAMPAVPAAPSGGTAPATPAPDSPTAVPADPSTGADPVRRAPAAGEKPDKSPVRTVRPSQLPTVPGVGKAPKLPVRPSPPQSALPTLPGSLSDPGHDEP